MQCSVTGRCVRAVGLALAISWALPAAVAAQGKVDAQLPGKAKEAAENAGGKVKEAAGAPGQGREKKEAAADRARGGTGQARKEARAKMGKVDARHRKQLNQETRKHLKRMAQFTRLEAIARKKKSDALLEKIAMLREKELKRHGRVLARIQSETGDEEVDTEDTTEETEASEAEDS